MKAETNNGKRLFISGPPSKRRICWSVSLNCLDSMTSVFRDGRPPGQFAGWSESGQSRTRRWSPACSPEAAMAEPTPLFVGLDVHKDSIAGAHALGHSADP